MFIDQATIRIVAGKGGNGVMSFRRERFIDRGGPDGGDGGKGGDVVARVKDSIHGLADYRHIKQIKADSGKAGDRQNRHGRNGVNTVITLPRGTIIREGDEIVAELLREVDEVVIAKGGQGGFGNAHFKSSTRQAPKIAETGEPGEERELTLELKLIADVGLVGLPNAGKSTFLSVVSNAKPKIANYPFTTLSPNLGIADVDGESIVIADIPGIIEGASEGKGLGVEFLKHVERTAVLLHLIDITDDDFATSYKTILNELGKYTVDLSKRPRVVVATKIDSLDEKEATKRVKKLGKLSGQDVFPIASPTRSGLEPLLHMLAKRVVSERQAVQDAIIEVAESTIPVFEFTEKEKFDSWKVEVSDEVYQVTGDKIERFARRLDLTDYYAQLRIKDIMHKMGIMQELRRKGAKTEAIIQIGKQQFPLQ